MNLIERTVTDLLELQAQGEVTATAITEAFLDSIGQRDPKIQAFLHVNSDGARQKAAEVDAKRQKGEPLGRLAGVPIALKDILCTHDMPTTCASKILEGFRPPYDAHVVERLRAADAVFPGKLNMDEFAMGSSNENSAFFPVLNPWDRSRAPGGSSGGSVASVAACLVPASLGTDTGGSIRQPASLCGIVGLKPTYGCVSRYGLVAFASSLDQVGPCTHDVRDAALLLEVIAGHDDRDSTSVNHPLPSYTKSLNEPVKPLTIGLAKEYFGQGLDPEVEQIIREAIKVYADLGATIKEVSLPHSPYAVAVYYIVATAEASSNLARYEGMHYGNRVKPAAGEKLDLIETYSRTRGQGFGPEVQRRIMLGTYALSSGYKDAYYLKGLKVRRLIKNDFDAAFAECDVVLGPTSPTAAFKIGEKSDDPLAMYLSDIYTISANLAGVPAISIPCGFTKQGLPVGLQLHASHFEEEKMLRVARMFEQATDWHTKRPTFAE